MDLRKTHKISKKHFTKHMRCNNNKITTLNIFLLSRYSTYKPKKKIIIINMFHINIKNFYNNDELNKIALTILSQLRMTEVNIIKKLGKEKKKITSQRLNARIPKGKEKKKRKKKDHFSLCVLFTSMVILLPT